LSRDNKFDLKGSVLMN